MSARIVAQLEILIARLSAAREILASLLPEPTELSSTERVVTMQPREVTDTATRESATPVQVTVLKPRGPRERRSAGRPSVPVATALAGAIPENPVAVSPRQLAEARESRSAEEPKNATAPRSAIEELMMEISQRSA